MVKNLTQKNEVLENAIGLRAALKSIGQWMNAQGAPYVRPIALLQAESKDKKDAQTFELVKKQLLELESQKHRLRLKLPMSMNSGRGLDESRLSDPLYHHRECTPRRLGLSIRLCVSHR